MLISPLLGGLWILTDIRFFPQFSTRSSVPYSQASRRTGPRRPREIVMPMPLSTAMDTDGGMAYMRPMASTSAAPLRDPYSAPPGPSSAPATAFITAPSPPHRSQDYVDETGSTRSRSALAWIKSRFNRSVSASTVPINIQIEPPVRSLLPFAVSLHA